MKLILGKPEDIQNAIMSIHPGAGGTESQDWAQMLYRLYSRWCEQKNFKINKVHSSDEVFVTGTFAGVIPVVEVDNITIGNGSRGIITKKLQKFYKTDIEKLSIVK